MNRKKKSERFNDYEGFVEKFKPKKTEVKVKSQSEKIVYTMRIKNKN